MTSGLRAANAALERERVTLELSRLADGKGRRGVRIPSLPLATGASADTGLRARPSLHPNQGEGTSLSGVQ